MKLLLISCSKSKKMTLGKMKAIDLYDGPSYRIIRKFIVEKGIPQGLDIYIISGKYGLIKWDDEIEFYEQKISDKAMDDTGAVDKLRAILSRGYDDVFVNMGKEYLKYFENILEDAQIVEGRIGEKNSKMKRWLESGF
ncbi:MAG: DUF6884 domain-containing protein [Candidatus Methanofastidiosia archaeon]